MFQNTLTPAPPPPPAKNSLMTDSFVQTKNNNELPWQLMTQ